VSVRRRAARATANFRRSLERVESFLAAADVPREFESLVQRLSEDIVPTLERFPDIGADFLGRAPLSAEGRALFAKVASLLGPGTSLRQFVFLAFAELACSVQVALGGNIRAIHTRFPHFPP